MKQKRKICVVTGTRAEYGLLYWLMKGVQCDSELSLQLIATGMHLSPEFGLSFHEIEQDNFRIDLKVEMLLSADTPSAISKSMGLAMIGFADAFDQLKPDLLLVLGDRFEILSATTVALNARLPIVHLSGGEETRGSIDEAFRHCITKMAWLHFVATEAYRKKVVQLGEEPKRVFNVGGLGVDAIKKTRLLSKKELMTKTGIRFGRKNLLVTFHPVTLEKETSKKQFQLLLNVLYDLKDVYLIFTMPNADTDSRIIKHMIDDFENKHKERSIAFTSMGHKNYLSTMRLVDAVVGNSSSGLAEAPSFKVGTINIGDRQKGRIKAKSVIDCEPTESSIRKAMDKLYSEDFQNSLSSVKNPYGEGNATEKIMEKLSHAKIPKELKKKFYSL